MSDSLATSDHVSNSASSLRYQEVFVIANHFFVTSQSAMRSMFIGAAYGPSLSDRSLEL
jgi:hypothetical protein